MTKFLKSPFDGRQNFSIKRIGLCPVSSTNTQGKSSVPCLFISFKCRLAERMFFLLSNILPLTTCSAYQVVSNLSDGFSLIAPIFILSFFHAIKLKFCLTFLTFLEIVEFFVNVAHRFFR